MDRSTIPVMYNTVCKVCNFPFDNTTHRSSICPDCDRKHHQEYNLAWQRSHKESRAKTMRKYRENGGKDRDRQRKLGGKVLPSGEDKRPFLGFCELCGRTYEDDRHKFHYHHWIEEEPTIGIWVCVKCHWMVEAVDTGLLQKYNELKLKIEEECAMKMLERFGLMEVCSGQKR